ncbi:MAG TPA: alpha/beta fold hydrolase [Candidatus Bathyarchaeia archaeon]|nr:alpha/beta fold hydrolase [Candidatus Bathyarchaeia archaeon]
MKASFAVVLLFLCSTSFLTAQSTPASSAPQGQKELTIEDLFQPGGILGRGPENVQWSPDGTKVSFVQRDDTGQHGELYYVDVATGKSAVLVASGKLATLAPPTSATKDERKKEAAQRYSIAAYHWAPDSKHLLFDSMGQLWYYSLDTGTAVQLTSSNDESSDPKFSPAGDRISYLRKHNLYVRAVDGGYERQLTKDGNDDLLNGEVDWVYEEELYSRSNYFWSPDGKHIIFLQMNEKEVPTYPITDWMPVHASVDQEKYPQPGDPNPGVRLGVVGSGGGKLKWLSTPASNGALPLGNDPDVLLPRFGWVSNGLIWAMVLNRVQDRMVLYFVDPESGKWQQMMTETTDAWIDLDQADLKMLPSGDGFLWTSWRDGHNHIYLYRFRKEDPLGGPAELAMQLTQGDWEVESIDGIDEQQGIVYFSANEGDWRQRNEFAVGLDGKNFHRVSQRDGSHFDDFDPKNSKYYVDNYSALSTPPSASLCSVGGSCTPFWQARSVEAYHLLTPKFVDFKAADGTTTLQGEILLPEGGPMIANGKAPLILNPYGGPGPQTVRDAWLGGDLFDQILARQGFAVLHVDNRGMGNRGKAFALPIKHHFGPTELADQLAATKQALQQFPQLDGSRIGVWGWSYGGYFTLYAMEHSDMFKSGVSVAPPANWLLYDTIYTERYMGLPKGNEKGYHDSSAVNFAKDLNGKLLEVHGTSDDNVHMQNTIQMVNNLIDAGKQFQLMMYPGKTHGIAGKAARDHLFHLIDDHFLETLAPGK